MNDYDRAALRKICERLRGKDVTLKWKLLVDFHDAVTPDVVLELLGAHDIVSTENALLNKNVRTLRDKLRELKTSVINT